MTATFHGGRLGDAGVHIRRIDRLRRATTLLVVTCCGLSVALIGLSVWLALLPLAFWTGWIQLASP
jgi:hypothetical protein